MGIKKTNAAHISRGLNTTLAVWAACGMLGAMAPIATAAEAKSNAEAARSAIAGKEIAQGLRVINVDSPNASKSLASVVDSDGKGQRVVLRNAVILRTDGDWRELGQEVDQLMLELNMPSVRVRTENVTDQRARVLETSSVDEAIRLAEIIRNMGWFGDINLSYTIHRPANLQNGQPVGPVTTDLRGAGFNDPAVAVQWHLDNSNTGFEDHDLNVAEVHAQGILGEGVHIGLIAATNARFEADNPELVNKFSEELSQEPDLTLDPDILLTGYATIMAAEANNATDGVGVAPSATISALIASTARLEFDAYSYRRNDIDIHHIEGDPFDYFASDDILYHTADGDYVLDAQFNAFGLGRSRKGIPQVFGTGFWGTFVGWDRFNIGNAISLPVVGDYLDVDSSSAFLLDGSDGIGLRYAHQGSRIHFHQPAALRQAFVIAPINEDNSLFAFSTLGTEIIASAYSGDGTTDTGSLGGVVGSFPGGGVALYSGPDVASANAAGVIALMLDANPNLSIRDIQHIIVETARILPGMDFVPGSVYGFNTNWEVNGGNYIHSDEYGFGVIDAEAAVAMAQDWEGISRLFVLDTGVVEVEDGGDIPDAEFLELDEFNSIVIQNAIPNEFQFCVRQDHTIEHIEIDLQMSGTGSNDLLIWLTSPQGTVSYLQYPNEFAFSLGFPSPLGIVDTAYLQHKFTTYKHWGEPSGGIWELRIQDWGPDADTPVGDEDDGDVVTQLGLYGIPGNDDRDEKTLEFYQVKIFGTDTGEPIFDGCNPVTTSCPGDLDGNGIVDFFDFLVFLNWYNTGNAFADINGNGIIDFLDVIAFRGLWQPGFCGDSGLTGGRPLGTDGNNDSPLTRPI